ncbi:little elongation complex subunit 2 isoform X1 [Cherax quadricarinatus]|uniref:little elongation complex subunit 2 isoform X1 n=1 Tax=Cherax quadricarinatus TaxID=27406 RepID=UPI00387ED4DA
MGLRDIKNSSEPCESSQPLRILVRHSVHGLSRFKNEKLLSKAYTIYPKLENQAYFGCEVNTLSEITQQWIQLLTRPNTTLLQEEKDLPMVLKEGQEPHIGFQPHQLLATLHSVFSAVCRIVTGHYILHHDPKTEAFITLLKATDSDKEVHLQKFNLHAVYSTGSVNTKNYTVPPWLALDTHVLTPFHLKHCKIPATFPMDNPTKVLTKGEKRKIKEKARVKRKLEDLDKPKEEDETEDYMEAIKNTGTVRRRRREML